MNLEIENIFSFKF